MRRNIFDQTLGQAISCTIIFFLTITVMTKLPRGDLIWEILNIGLLILLVLLNIVMLVGFTSFQNEHTKTFYSYITPIYPLYLISEELIRIWEWWHYIVILISYGICFFILIFCFEIRTFARSIESIAIVIFIFSTPYLYSTLYSAIF